MYHASSPHFNQYNLRQVARLAPESGQHRLNVQYTETNLLYLLTEIAVLSLSLLAYSVQTRRKETELDSRNSANGI